MPGPLLHSRCDLTQPPVHLPAPPRRRTGVDHRGKQGVGEPDPGTLEPDDALAGRRPQRGQRRGATRLLQHRCCRRPQARGHQQGISGAGRERGQPGTQDTLQIGRHRQRFLRRGLGTSPLQRSGQLQAIERVPTRGVEQPADGKPGKCGTGRGLNSRLERAKGQGTDPKAREALSWQTCSGRRGGTPVPLIADRSEQAGLLAAEPPQGELHRVRARDIEPLQVVDGKDHRSRRGQVADHSKEGDSDRSLLGRAAHRIRQQQRDLQRPPLRRRQPGKRLVEDPIHQIAERRERQPCLRFGRPARQHRVGAPSGQGHTSAPDGCLADPGRTLQQQATRPRRHRIEEGSHRGHLTVAPHHARSRHRRPLRQVVQTIGNPPTCRHCQPDAGQTNGDAIPEAQAGIWLCRTPLMSMARLRSPLVAS